MSEDEQEWLYKDYQSMTSLGLLGAGDECLKDLAESYRVSVNDVLRIVDEVEEKMCGSVGGLVESVLGKCEGAERKQQKERVDALGLD